MAEQQSGRLCVIPARAAFDRNLDNAALRALSVLGTFSDRNGWCYPSLTKIAAALGVTRQAVSKQIKALIDLGYLEVREQFRSNGSRAVNLYRIVLDSGDPVGLGDTDGIPRNPQVASPATPRLQPERLILERPIKLTNTTHAHEGTHTSAEHAPTHAHEDDAETPTGSAAKWHPDKFAVLWGMWKRKANKARAIKAWDRLKPDKATRIAIKGAIESMQWPTEQQFIPHLATWLNERRWEDETPHEAPRAFPAI